MNRMNLNNVYTESHLSILTQQRAAYEKNEEYLRTKRGNDFLIVPDMFKKNARAKLCYLDTSCDVFA